MLFVDVVCVMMHYTMNVYIEATFDCTKFQFLRIETLDVGEQNLLVIDVLCWSSHCTSHTKAEKLLNDSFFLIIIMCRFSFSKLVKILKLFLCVLVFNQHSRT